MNQLSLVLDRIADEIASPREGSISIEDDVQFIYRRNWRLSTAQLLEKDDELKKAIKASVIETLSEIFCEKRGCREDLPSWVEGVKPLKERISVIHPSYQDIFQGEEKNENFNKRNIFAPKNYLTFF